MVDDDRYCIEVLDQVSAATRALQSVALELLDDHLAHCVADAVAAGGARRTPSSTRPPPPSPGWSGRDEAQPTRPRSPLLLVDIGRSLREGFFMFWETLWPLILGFGLSGAVQSFVSRDAMQRSGRPPPGLGARASRLRHGLLVVLLRRLGHGQVPLRQGRRLRGRLVFMFASTNLVIELGIVLVVLMGWQFAVSEFVGGVIMIVLLALAGGLWLRGRLVVAGRGAAAVARGRRSRAPGHAGHGARRRPRRAQPWWSKLRSAGGWADAATYTMADLTMLRKELVIGYPWPASWPSVPAHVWNAVFLHGHGFWTSVENVIVGRSSPSSVSSARSATCHWPPPSGTAASPSAA